MHEKTLLYSALGATALAAVLGVGYARSRGESAHEGEITSVTLTDAERTVARAEVPVRLTASDGTGLKLVALRAEAAIEDPLALTELHLTFENPEARVLEGTFRITLPQGASLSRFAMKVGDAWQEGEVVEKQAARQAYEDFLHRRQDPALLEQGAGNEFTARVFPIPAKGTKEIIVTYAETLAIGQSYVLPLKGLPELGRLDVNAHVAGTDRERHGYGVHQQKVTPAGDFVVVGRQLPRSSGLRSGELAIARVVPFASSRPEPLGSAIFLVDTSASRGLGIEEQVKELRAVLAKLPADTKVSIACFDQEVAPVFDGAAGGFGDKEASAIVTRGALGASDFEAALAWAGDQAKKTKATRVVLVTDGVATAGETDGQKLRAKVEALRGAGVARLDAVAIGGIRDDGFLRTLTRGVLDRDGVVLDAALGPEAVARRLAEATSAALSVKVDGARWSWPRSLEGLQAGDEVLVFAEVEEGKKLVVDVGGQQFTPDLRTAERPLVERAWAQAKIQSLLESPDRPPAATKAEIVALSTRHRVLSPYTALLVLENDWDYRRFNIDRNAKLDILTVRDGKVAITEASRGGERVEEQRRKAESARDSKGGAPKSAVAEPVAPSPAAAPAAPPATATAAAAADREEAPAFANAAPGGGPPPIDDALAGSTGSRAAGDEGTLGGLGLSGSGAGGGGQGAGRGAARPTELADGIGAAPPPPPAATMAPPAQAMASAAVAHEDAPRPRAAVRPRPSRPSPPCDPGDPLCAPSTPPTGNVTGMVRPGALSSVSGIAPEEAQRVLRGAIPQYRACYETALGTAPQLRGHVALRFAIGASGEPSAVEVTQAPGSDVLRRCLEVSSRALRFPAPGAGGARFVQELELVGGTDTGAVADEQDPSTKARPYEGRFKTVMEAIARGDGDEAVAEARRWHTEAPGDILSLVALGEAFEAKNDLHGAARAYGSILELYSFRADSRRFAGERLERLHDPAALALAADTYGKAAEQRPDHPASHRLYAYTLLKKGDYEKAFVAIRKGAQRTYPAGRFRGVDRILREDMGLVAAAWMHAEPARAGEIRSQLLAAGGTEERGPSLRFVLNWETDANDVDFHIRDGKGGHAYYAQPSLASGGDLYADVTTGYGPECFTIRGAQRAYPYTLQAHYYARGPMGYGMGKLEIVDHDGKGNLTFEERPFVVMVDHAFVDMGRIERPTKAIAAR